MLFFACSAALASGRPTLAITDVVVVDVERGRLSGPRTVLIDDGRIVRISTPWTVSLPDGVARIDGHGRFLIPGLVDMHVHLFNNVSHRPPNEWSFPLYVANGVTGVREMAARPASIAVVDGWRRALAEGTLIAPHVLAAGVVAWGPSPEKATQQVERAADAGGDFIKVFSEIGEPAWRAVLVAARRRSLPVMGHVPAGVSAIVAARAGQRSEEHLMQIFEACSTFGERAIEARRRMSGAALVARRDAEEGRVLATYDATRCERTAKLLASTGTVQVPTLVLTRNESDPAYASPASDPRWRYLRSDERERWLRIAHDTEHDDADVAARRWPVARKIVAALHRAGVVILAGTDSPMPGVYPGFALHEELERLVDAGLSPAEALRAATYAPAVFLHHEQSAGSVAEGKRADLVLLDADPLSDISNTRRIDAVVLDGRLIRRGELDALLAEASRVADPDLPE